MTRSLQTIFVAASVFSCVIAVISGGSFFWAQSHGDTVIMMSTGIICLLSVALIAVNFVYIYPKFKQYMQLENWAYCYSDHRQKSKPPKIGVVSDLIRKLLKRAKQNDFVVSNFDQKLRRQALLDRETGLGNREFFNNRLEALLKEEDVQGAVYFVHFNEAELILSLYGASQARMMLEQVVNTIKRQVMKYPGAHIARRRSYELAIILPNVFVLEAEKLAQRLIRSLSALSLPVGVSKESFVHIGVSYFSHAENSYQIKSEADMALRSAQLQGPSQWFMYEPGEVEHISAKGSLQWRTFLEKAINNNAFVLFFQPVISNHNAAPIHHEVLAKVRDRDGGLISARVFLPMAVKSGMASEVDLLIVEQVCRLLTYDQPLKDDCSLNLSIDSLLSENFVSKLQALAEKYQDVCSQIIIEIAEYHLVNHLDALRPVLDKLNAMGFRLLVDKVGQYVESAEYLKLGHVRYLKLHPSIVGNIDKKPENQVFVQSLSAICEQQHVAMYALGVETSLEWRTLLKLGVSGGQGHFFTEPVAQMAKAIQLP